MKWIYTIILICVLVYGILSPYRWLVFVVAILFGAHTIYRYIIYKAQNDI